MTIDMLKIGTPVRAAYPGRVLRVTRQPETCDAEVYIDSAASRAPGTTGAVG